jgi:hypothetical protein
MRVFLTVAWQHFISDAISHWGISAFTSLSIFPMSTSERCFPDWIKILMKYTIPQNGIFPSSIEEVVGWFVTSSSALSWDRHTKVSLYTLSHYVPTDPTLRPLNKTISLRYSISLANKWDFLIDQLCGVLPRWSRCFSDVLLKESKKIIMSWI